MKKLVLLASFVFGVVFLGYTQTASVKIESGKHKILVAINPSGNPTKTTFRIPGVEPNGRPVMDNGVALKNHGDKFTLEMKRVSYGVFKLK